MFTSQVFVEKTAKMTVISADKTNGITLEISDSVDSIGNPIRF